MAAATLPAPGGMLDSAAIAEASRRSVMHLVDGTGRTIVSITGDRDPEDGESSPRDQIIAAVRLAGVECRLESGPGVDPPTRVVVGDDRVEVWALGRYFAEGTIDVGHKWASRVAARVVEALKPAAFVIRNASIRGPGSFSWRPVGAKRSKVTGISTHDAAVASLHAAGYRLVERPRGE